MPNHLLRALLQKYADNQITAGETEDLFRLIGELDDHTINDELYELLANTPTAPEYDEHKWSAVVERALAQGDAIRGTIVPEASTTRVFTLRRSLVAAAITGTLLIGGYWLLNRVRPKPSRRTTADNAVIKAPVTDKAVLQLEDGTTIAIDSLQQQKPVQLKQVTQKADGTVVYGGKAQQQGTHTLSNPRGSKVVQLQLGDGTLVWLNAASSIRYPAEFAAGERRVTVSGEAYFEVAKDAKRPFIVATNSLTTEVLGTHFDVKAYKEEDAKVTLLEGKVVVRSDAGSRKSDFRPQTSVTLKPGQQAVATADSLPIAIGITTHEANVEEAIAWKRGYFSFAHKSITELVNELARWYDITIEFDPSLAGRRFGGGIERGADLNQVIQILKESKINCRLEGRTLYLNK